MARIMRLWLSTAVLMLSVLFGFSKTKSGVLLGDIFLSFNLQTKSYDGHMDLLAGLRILCLFFSSLLGDLALV
jgi:hypothetical protein